MCWSGPPRPIATSRRTTSRPELGLAVTADVLSEALWQMGWWQEAVDFGREAVQTWRRCVARDAAAEHREQLVIALHGLPGKLRAAGQASAWRCG